MSTPPPEKILLTQASADTTYAPRVVDLVSSLPSRFYVGHRGGALVYPEHSMEAYRACFDSGHLIELDLQVLADGKTYVCIHDDSVDRTMLGATGKVNTLTLQQWKSLRIKGVYPTSPTATPVTLEEALDAFGGRTVLMLEVKSGVQQDVWDIIHKRGLERAVIAHSYSVDTAKAAAAQGIAASWMTDVDTADFAGARAAGVEFVACSYNVPAAYFTNAAAAGMKITPFTVNTKGLADTTLAQPGVVGVYSDDPWGCSGWYPTRSVDPFREQKPWPRMVLNGGVPVVFQPPGEFGRTDISTAVVESVEMGWAGSFHKNVRIEATLRFLGPASAEAQWAGIAYGQFLEDSTYKDGGFAGQASYHALVRRNGARDLYRNNGVGTIQYLGGITGAAALPAGGPGTIRVSLEVNATGVIFKDLTNGVQLSSPDVVIPRSGGRVALTFNQAACLVSDVTVIDL